MAFVEKLGASPRKVAWLYVGRWAGDRLLGFPVHLSEDVPDLSANSLSVAFGDFASPYAVVQRPGIRLLRDPPTATNRTCCSMPRRGSGEASWISTRSSW